MEHHIVIAMDGTSASGKSTNAKLIARSLGYVYVDTGAMYRTLAWYCLKKKVDVDDHKAVASLCRRWKTELKCIEGELRHVRLLVDDYYPEKEVRTAETSAAVAAVAAVPKVRDWMKKAQRTFSRRQISNSTSTPISPNAPRVARPRVWTKISPRATNATASAPQRR